jgi:hypothetical protein
MIKKKNLLLIIILLILLFSVLLSRTKINFENFSTNKENLFSDLLENHYDKIFPNNANRNSAGFRFFKYIYDNLATSNELFDIYNQFYCAVSGSIVSPSRPNNYDILKVNDNNNNCVYGKYYRCCTPCNCDIMKYATVIDVNLEIPKNSGKFYSKKLLTIGDPCIDESKLPPQLDKNVFRCKNNLLEKGYRVNKDNVLTENEGRLVIGVLYPLEENESKDMVQRSLNICLSGTKRLLNSPDELRYGMGDIFVKLALINNNKNYTNTISDLCN